MTNRRLAFWIYWLVAVGMAGCIGNSVPADANISQIAGQETASVVEPSEGMTDAAAPTPAVAEPVAAILAPAYDQVGVASWYGGWFQGRLTASGKRFDEKQLTAAHRSLPLATKVLITNLENGRSVEVTVNDRGPYVKGRVLDLSTQAAKMLGMTKQGLALVRIEVLPDEPGGSAVN